MPPIKSSNVIDSSVQKAFTDLNVALKTTIDNLNLIIADGKKLNETFANNTGIAAYNKAAKDLSTIKNEANALTKTQLDLLQKEEKLKQDVARTTIAQEKAMQTKNRTAQQEATIAAKQTAATAKLTSAYAQESKKLTELRNKAKDVAVQFGLSSNEFKTAASEITKLDAKLKKIDASLGQNQRSVGKYTDAWNKVKGGLLAVTAAIAAASGAMRVGKEVIDSTQVSGDSFAMTIEGMKQGWESFKKSIATGDLLNMISNFEKAIKAGEAYAAALDDLGDRRRGMTIAEKEGRLETEELKQDVDNVNLSKDERIVASEKIITIEKKLAEQRVSIANQQLSTELAVVQALTGLNEEETLSFIKNYDAQEDLRKRAIRTLDLEAERKSARQTGDADYYKSVLKQHKEHFASLTKEELAYLEVFKKYGKTKDSELDRVVVAYSEVIDAESNFFTQTRRSANQRNTLQKALNKTTDETIVKNKELKVSQEKLAEVPAQIKEAGVIDDEAVLADMDKLNDAEIELYLEKEEEKTRILQEHEERRKELKAELLQQGFDTAVSIGDSLFDYAISKLTDETEAITAEYDTRLDNDKLDDEVRSAIEAERDAKINEKEKKQRELEKKQFLFGQAVQATEVAIDTAKKVAAIQATAAVLLANPLTAAFAPIALSQIPLVIGTGAAAAAAILAKSLPAFDKGVNSAPDGGFLAGEKRPEFMKHKGKISLVDKPTLFGDEYKGAKVWSGVESAKILDNITRKEMIKSVVNINDDTQSKMIAAAVEKSFERHSDRMINEMKNNRPKKRSGLDSLKRTDDLIKRFAR